MPERVNYRGEVERALEESDLRELATTIRARLNGALGTSNDPSDGTSNGTFDGVAGRAGDVPPDGAHYEGVAVAVNLLFSYVNPTPERQVRDFLQAEFPGLAGVDLV